MKSLVIRLNVAEQVKRFVNLVDKYDMPMDIRSGRYIVNAKSILGLFSLDLSRPLQLEIDDTQVKSDIMKKLLQDLSRFAADKSSMEEK